MTPPHSTKNSSGHVRPETQSQQKSKQEKLAAALRANLRRRKAPAPTNNESA